MYRWDQSLNSPKQLVYFLYSSLEEVRSRSLGFSAFWVQSGNKRFTTGEHCGKQNNFYGHIPQPTKADCVA